MGMIEPPTYRTMAKMIVMSGRFVNNVKAISHWGKDEFIRSVPATSLFTEEKLPAGDFQIHLTESTDKLLSIFYTAFDLRFFHYLDSYWCNGSFTPSVSLKVKRYGWVTFSSLLLKARRIDYKCLYMGQPVYCDSCSIEAVELL